MKLSLNIEIFEYSQKYQIFILIKSHLKERILNLNKILTSIEKMLIQKLTLLCTANNQLTKKTSEFLSAVKSTQSTAILICMQKKSKLFHFSS